MNSSQVIRVSWTDATHGVTVYDTLCEKVAREIHSEVMGNSSMVMVSPTLKFPSLSSEVKKMVTTKHVNH